MLGSNEARVEAPLLRGYLREVASDPPFVPHWPAWITWTLFAVLVVALHQGFVLWLILAIAAPHIARARYRPRNEREKQEIETYRAIRKFKTLNSDGRIRRRIVPEVLAALERATSTHHAVRAQIMSEHSFDMSERIEQLNQSLNACIRIALPAMRWDDQPKREWQAVGANRSFVTSMVDSIDAQRRRMGGLTVHDTERLAALRELESDLPPMPPLHLYSDQ